jgi:hypothetical protein
MTCGAARSILPGRASHEVRSSRDNVASSCTDGGQSREAKAATPSIQGGWEPGLCGMVNSGEALLNVVTKAKRKMLNRLDQKGTWSGPEAPNSSGAADAPPAERRDLTHTVTAAERGKPVVSPAEVGQRAS